jgi:hypothetical protein
LRFAALQSVIGSEVADPLVHPRFQTPAVSNQRLASSFDTVPRARLSTGSFSHGPVARFRDAFTCHLSAARKHRTLLLGFRSPSRHQHQESTLRWAFRAQLRSALSVSHALDGLLLLAPSWACFIPQPRPGFSLQGFLPAAQPTRLSTRRPLLPFPSVLLLPNELDSARARRLAFRVLIQTTVRSDWQRG